MEREKNSYHQIPEKREGKKNFSPKRELPPRRGEGRKKAVKATMAGTVGEGEGTIRKKKFSYPPKKKDSGETTRGSQEKNRIRPGIDGKKIKKEKKKGVANPCRERGENPTNRPVGRGQAPCMKKRRGLKGSFVRKEGKIEGV